MGRRHRFDDDQAAKILVEVIEGATVHSVAKSYGTTSETVKGCLERGAAHVRKVTMMHSKDYAAGMFRTDVPIIEQIVRRNHELFNRSAD